jgi:hypothetical protein
LHQKNNNFNQITIWGGDNLRIEPNFIVGICNCSGGCSTPTTSSPTTPSPTIKSASTLSPTTPNTTTLSASTQQANVQTTINCVYNVPNCSFC